LPAGMRMPLVAMAVAARPIGQAMLGRIVEPDMTEGALARLRAERWVEVREGGLETAHDRLREAIYATLVREERASWHRRLAETFETAGAGDPEGALEHSQ